LCQNSCGGAHPGPPAWDMTRCHITQRARLVRDPDDEHLARAIGDAGRVQGAGYLAPVVGHELDDPALLVADPVDRLDVDRTVTLEHVLRDRDQRGDPSERHRSCHAEQEPRVIPPARVRYGVHPDIEERAQ
jgi:hypothetical protein